jgi:hypothetical protein
MGQLNDPCIHGVPSAQPTWIRRDADAAQVEPVGIPAGHDGRFTRGVAVTMQAHRLAQMLEAGRVELVDHAVAAQLHCEVSRPAPVPGIATVVDALAVVQEREPRQQGRVDVQRSSQRPPMKPHPAPMRQAVDATGKVQPETEA